jgi:hypothetical protein
MSLTESTYSVNLDEIPEELRLLPPVPPLIRRVLPDGSFDQGEGIIIPRIKIRRADTWDRVSTVVFGAINCI